MYTYAYAFVYDNTGILYSTYIAICLRMCVRSYVIILALGDNTGVRFHSEFDICTHQHIRELAYTSLDMYTTVQSIVVYMKLSSIHCE